MTIAAVSIKQKGLENVQTFFKETKKRMTSFEPPLKKGGVMMLRSIDQNFKQAGRPVWKPLSRQRLAWKLRHGYSPLPLTMHGDLRRSVTYRVNRNRLFIGTSVPYAKYHQFGTRRIPKRTFLLFQDVDVDRINRLILEHITQEAS